MNVIDAVALLGLLQYFAFGALVGRARTRYGVKAPAVVGHEMFERAYRVQMNTLELLVAWLPALYLAAHYWRASWVAGVGAVYLVGRLVYWRAYMSQPGRRSPGFVLSAMPVLVLLFGALIGALRAWV